MNFEKSVMEEKENCMTQQEISKYYELDLETLRYAINSAKLLALIHYEFSSLKFFFYYMFYKKY